MAKRFTDTEKWNKKFIRELKPAYKLLWFFILDHCNHAGIWDVDFEMANMRVGMPVTEKEAIKYFGHKIICFDKNEKWFIPSFIEFQYGELAENNRAHTKSIFLLKKYNLLNNEYKPLTSPLQGDKVEVEVEVEAMAEVEVEAMAEVEVMAENKKVKPENKFNALTAEFEWLPTEWDNLFRVWLKYKSEIKDTYKSEDTVKIAFKNLLRISEDNIETAMLIVQNSIANNYKGLFPLREKTKLNGITNRTAEQEQDIINRHFASKGS